METEAEKAQELDARFVILAENEVEGCALVQFTSRMDNVLVYTGKGGHGRFRRAPIPIATFMELAREVLTKLDAGEIEVE